MRLLEISTAFPNGQATLTARRSIIAERNFSPGDVVWVPFPFVEAPKLRDRPALVVAAHLPVDGIHLLWVLMITSAANAGWKGDVSLKRRFAECGLQVPCVVRTAKITTIDASRASECGALPADLFDEVKCLLGGRLGLG